MFVWVPTCLPPYRFSCACVGTRISPLHSLFLPPMQADRPVFACGYLAACLPASLSTRPTRVCVGTWLSSLPPYRPTCACVRACLSACRCSQLNVGFTERPHARPVCPSGHIAPNLPCLVHPAAAARTSLSLPLSPLSFIPVYLCVSLCGLPA